MMNNPFGSTNAIQQPQQEQQPQNDGMTWWFRWLIKIVTVLCGVLGLVSGFVAAISLTGRCIIAGVILILSSFLVLAFEVPIFCSFIKIIEPLSRFSSNRPHWQKTIMYMIPPIVVIILCTSFSSILGALALVGVAAIYFMLTVGKKAPLDQMRARAAGDTSKSTLVTNEQLPK